MTRNCNEVGVQTDDANGQSQNENGARQQFTKFHNVEPHQAGAVKAGPYRHSLTTPYYRQASVEASRSLTMTRKRSERLSPLLLALVLMFLSIEVCNSFSRNTRLVNAPLNGLAGVPALALLRSCFSLSVLKVTAPEPPITS